MNVGEVKKLVPLSDVYELKEEGRYVIQTSGRISFDVLDELKEKWQSAFAEKGIKVFVLINPFEIGELE